MDTTTVIFLNITDESGRLLGRVKTTAGALAAARRSAPAALALADDITDEAGIR